MKVILIPVADRPECKLALDTAFLLADAFDGNVVGCHLRPHRLEDVPGRPGGSFLGFRRFGATSSTLSDRQIQLNSRAAEALFRQQAGERDFRLVKRPRVGAEKSAQWIEMVGSLDKLFPIVGPASDVAVVSRPKKSSKGPGMDFMLAALLETGKPILLLPQAPVTHVARRILIAWNQSVQAARAVAAAIPLLQQAESVHILCAGPESRPGPRATALVNYLACWGVRATHSRSKGRDASAEIHAAFRKEGADLIVMGAYSRGRFREMVFGGVTEDLLFRAGPPVFALHS